MYRHHQFFIIFKFLKIFFNNFYLQLNFDREARAKMAYNTLQKVSTQLELPNLRNHVCRNIAYFADSADFRGHNVQKIKNIYFSSLLVLSFTIAMQK